MRCSTIFLLLLALIAISQPKYKWLSDTSKVDYFVKQSIVRIMTNDSLINDRSDVFTFLERSDIINNSDEAIKLLGKPVHTHYFKDAVFCFMYSDKDYNKNPFNDYFCILFDEKKIFIGYFIYFSDNNFGDNWHYWYNNKTSTSNFNSHKELIPPDFRNVPNWLSR